MVVMVSFTVFHINNTFEIFQAEESSLVMQWGNVTMISRGGN